MLGIAAASPSALPAQHDGGAPTSVVAPPRRGFSNARDEPDTRAQLTPSFSMMISRTRPASA